MVENPIVEITPSAQGLLGKLKVISPEGTCFMVLGYVGMSSGMIFSVKTEDYSFSLYIYDHFAELKRNDYSVVVPLAVFDRTHVFLLEISWRSDSLLIGIADREGKREQSTKTPICFPPNSLKDWARRESLIPTILYDNPRHFFETVFSQFQQLKTKIIDTNAINGFWDIQYSGSKIDSKKPKRETDIHPQIRLLLYDLEILKNIQIIPEHPIGSGKLDFLITGTLTDGKTECVCVEFKLAHSSDIAHGIQLQLPEYMDRRNTDYGIYCVLDFGNEFKSDTSKFIFKTFNPTNTSLDTILQIAASETGKKFMKTIIFNLSKKISPSKM